MELSVIITASGDGAALRETLASLRAQRANEGWEAVVIWDRPEGASLPEEEAFPAPLRFVAREGCGEGAARNRGLVAAVGDFVLFLKEGDVLLPGALGTMFAEMDANNPDILVFDGEKALPGGKLAPCPASSAAAGEISAEDYLFSLPEAWNKWIRRRIFVDEGLRFPEDTGFEDLALIPALGAWGEKIRYVKTKLCRRPESPAPAWDREEMNCLPALDRLIRLVPQYGAETELVTFRRLFGDMAPRAMRAADAEALRAISAFMADKFPGWEKDRLLKKEPRKLRALAHRLAKKSAKHKETK